MKYLFYVGQREISLNTAIHVHAKTLGQNHKGHRRSQIWFYTPFILGCVCVCVEGEDGTGVPIYYTSHFPYVHPSIPLYKYTIFSLFYPNKHIPFFCCPEYIPHSWSCITPSVLHIKHHTLITIGTCTQISGLISVLPV